MQSKYPHYENKRFYNPCCRFGSFVTQPFHYWTSPIEVKSGNDYRHHVALSRFVSTEDYHIDRGCVLTNNKEVEMSGNIVYIPIYYSLFFKEETYQSVPVLI